MTNWPEMAGKYRPVEGDVLHPDDCVIIRIMGAEWRVRPLQLPDGIRYTPQFGDTVEFKQTIDPLGNEPMQERARELLRFARTEPDNMDLLSAVCDYLSRLLDQQYSLTDEIKGDLLCFRGEAIPMWFNQAIRHANGISPQETLTETLVELLPDVAEEPVEEPRTKRFWQFWK